MWPTKRTNEQIPDYSDSPDFLLDLLDSLKFGDWQFFFYFVTDYWPLKMLFFSIPLSLTLSKSARGKMGDLYIFLHYKITNMIFAPEKLRKLKAWTVTAKCWCCLNQRKGVARARQIFVHSRSTCESKFMELFKVFTTM